MCHSSHVLSLLQTALTRDSGEEKMLSQSITELEILKAKLSGNKEEQKGSLYKYINMVRVSFFLHFLSLLFVFVRACVFVVVLHLILFLCPEVLFPSLSLYVLDQVFQDADNEDRTSTPTKKTAIKFRQVGLWIDVATEFGVLSEDLKSKKKYATWKVCMMMSELYQCSAAPILKYYHCP